MKLDSFDGRLLIKPTGKDGAVVLTLKDGKQIRYEEKDGEIFVTEQSLRKEKQVGANMIVLAD